MTKPRIAVIVGSNRKESINRKLAGALARLGAGRLEFVPVVIDDLPLYNPDLEADRPAAVRRFTDAVAGVDGLLVVTPEHNRGLPAVLKNAIDWGSKPADKNVWRGKPALIAGTSPGALGAALAQAQLRHVLGILGALVMGGEAYVTWKPDLVDGDGGITVESTRAFLQGHVDQFADLVTRLAR